MPIEIISTGLIAKNPKPHVRSVHAYFPSVVRLADGEMLATVALAQAFEAADMRTHLYRSTDGGETWQHEGRVCDDVPGRIVSDASRLTATPDGKLVCYMVRMDRTDHPDEGLSNPETLGFVPTELTLLRSDDRGRSWSVPRRIEPPIDGPCFELCSPITVLRDGRWVIPTLTWPDWQGRSADGVRMVALVSRDGGRTWPEHWEVMSEGAGRVFFWESKIVELPDNRLLAVAWTYDDVAKSDRPNHYAVSVDGGATWSPPTSTELAGQTLTPIVLRDGRVLCVYRRMDRPGLWAVVARLDGDRWVNDEQAPIWGADTAGLTESTDDMAHNFNVLRFGAPSLAMLDDGTVFVGFWCYEECTSVVRWYKLRVA